MRQICEPIKSADANICATKPERVAPATLNGWISPARDPVMQRRSIQGTMTSVTLTTPGQPKVAQMITILHDPALAVSRRAVNSVASATEHANIVDVRAVTPEDLDLRTLASQLRTPPRDLLDRSSELYFALSLDDPKWSDVEVLSAAIDNPSLLRCPIVVFSKEIPIHTDACGTVAENFA